MPPRSTSVLVLSAVIACAAPPPATTSAPDLGRRAVGTRGVVTSAHPAASDAGVQMLRQGGNAIDAAVAAAFAIGVTEPEMSGVGGGGALLVWRARERVADYLDFYPSQPVNAWRGARSDSTVPLRVTGIPGNVAGLLAAHERFGRLPRTTVMGPAITLAEQGFPLYQVLAEMIARDTMRLRRDPVARSLFWPSGTLIATGETLRNPELATVLRRIADAGRDGFYGGEVAASLVRRLNEGGHPATVADLAAYQAQWKRPLCADYRGRAVLSAPPPQGGIQLLGTLQLMETRPIAADGLPTRSLTAFDLMVSAMRAGILIGRSSDDPRWRSIPARGLVSDAFAASWRDVVGTGRAADSLRMRPAEAFEAEVGSSCRSFDPYASPSAPSATGSAADAFAGAGDQPHGGETTHISVVDAEGNAVAVTVTNSSMFGARVAHRGFFLNDSGLLPAPATEAGGRDGGSWRTRRSTIAPTIVMRGAQVEAVVGSPGGGRIPLAMAQVIAYLVDYGLDPLDALRMPRFYPTTGRSVELENGFEPDLLAKARAAGYLPVAQSFGYARLYVIARRGEHWVGAADPRHDGQARAW